MKKSRRKIHPMWLLLFVIFGIALTSYTQNSLFFYLMFVMGIVVMLSLKNTPSKLTKFEKDGFQTTFVWSIIIISIFLLIFSDGFILFVKW